jgi:hypothetical protein
MSNETVSTNLDQLANHRMGLNTGALTNHNPFLNFNKRPNEAMIANRAFVEIGWLNNDHSGAELNVSDLGSSNVRTIHEFPLSISAVRA